MHLKIALGVFWSQRPLFSSKDAYLQNFLISKWFEVNGYLKLFSPFDIHIGEANYIKSPLAQSYLEWLSLSSYTLLLM